MGRFVGKLAVDGRLLEEAVGGSLQEEYPGVVRSSGRVAVSHAAEPLIRSSTGPIYLVIEGGPTLRVDLGRSQAVGELYAVFDFVGVLDDIAVSDDVPIFSILDFAELRGTGRAVAIRFPARSEIADFGDACPDPVLLAFASSDPDQGRRARSEGC